jgi:uncharacterized protein YcnI
MPHLRPLVLAFVLAGLLALSASPAAAHVSANPGEAAAGGYAAIRFRVGHGCEGEPTERLTIQIPDGVVSVKPEQIPGWTVETEIGPFEEPVELHGEQVTEGVKVVTWTAEEGNALPDTQFKEFGLSMRLPEDDGTLYFPTVQSCLGGGEHAWIEIPEEGADEPESPAPSVRLTAGGGGHGTEEPEDTPVEPALDREEEAALVPLAAQSQPSGWTIAALVLGAFALVTGIAGLVTARHAAGA